MEFIDVRDIKPLSLTMSSKGLMYLPKRLVEVFNIEEGDGLQFTRLDNNIMFCKVVTGGGDQCIKVYKNANALYTQVARVFRFLNIEFENSQPVFHIEKQEADIFRMKLVSHRNRIKRNNNAN